VDHADRVQRRVYVVHACGLASFVPARELALEIVVRIESYIDAGA
jgi:hypothetical protein